MDKKNKINNIIFIVIFACIILVPVLLMNHKTEQVSEIDNKSLTEWPGIGYSAGVDAEIDSYIDDRIGFREQAISFYTTLNDKLFDVMVHPLFMYGKEGHIFYKDKDYIAAYQRLNTDEEYLDSFVGFLQETKDYLDSKDIKFLYYLCPDKKSIYSEYFPETIHVNTANPSVIEYMRSDLEKTDIDYIIPDKELLNAKESMIVYNRLYDATHWNENGAFIGHTLIDQKIQEWFDDVPPLSVNDYSVEMVHMDTLDIAKFPIDEDVPVYSRTVDNTADMTELLKPCMQCYSDTFYSHYVNGNAENGKILLVFTDSYFQAHQKYYNNRFKEVYFVHRQNYEYVQYFVNLVFPDMVIFETAERSISSEMPQMADFTDYYYEPAYTGSEVSTDLPAGLSYTVIYEDGVRVDGNKLLLPLEGSNITRFDAVLNTPDDGDTYDVYISTDDETMEADFCKIHRDSEIDGVQYFQFNIQRRYMAQSHIKLIAENRRTHQAYLLEDFEVGNDE